MWHITAWIIVTILWIIWGCLAWAFVRGAELQRRRNK